MANEIQFDYITNANYLYAIIRNENGEVLKVSDLTFVEYPSYGSLIDFAINISYPDNGFLWRCDFPLLEQNKYYIIQIKTMTGSEPLYEDRTVGSSESYWTGTYLTEYDPYIIRKELEEGDGALLSSMNETINTIPNTGGTPSIGD
jgi:hypothetical protein